MSGRPAGGSRSSPGSAADLLARYRVLDPPVVGVGAAVTIVLRDGSNDTEVLLIERTTRASDPASGQVALPGGRVDERDGNLRATAIRELEEEVGLSEADLTGPVRFVRVQPAPRFRLHVGVFAGELATEGRSPRVHNSEEVAHVFWFPRHRLDPPQFERTLTARGPLDVPASRYEGHILWGFTRRVLREFFDLPPEPDLGGPLFAPSPSQSRTEASSASAPSGGTELSR